MSADGPQESELTQGTRPALPLRLRGLKVQIVLWTILPLSLVLIGVAFTGVYSHERAMRDLVQERDQALAVVRAGQVASLLRARAEALQRLAAQEKVLYGDRAAQQTLLAELGELDALFAGSVGLIEKNGEGVTADDSDPGWLGDTEQITALMQAAMNGQDVAVVPLIDTPGGEQELLIGVPVYDGTGEVYGVLAGSVSLDGLDLESLIGQAKVGDHGVVYLVDGAGEVLVHSSSERARTSFEGHSSVDKALQDPNAGTTLGQSPDHGRMTLSYAPVEFGNLDWRVLIEEPWNEVVGPVLRYSKFMPIVAGLAIVVSLLTLYYGIRAIVRPLQSLGQRAERVAWGDFDATATPVGGVEEIEELRRTLDQMAKRIQSYQTGMHDYIAAITKGQEEERKRLARELHDDTAQSLIALRQQVEMARKLQATDPERATKRLIETETMLIETLEGVRRFSRDLRPIYLEDLGFIPALEMLAREADQREELSIYFTRSGKVRRLEPDVELAAYRIVQEALNNTIQHAQAAHAWVEVHFDDEHLVLSVRDDGQGFEAPDLPDVLARRGHFGLMGIQERVLLYGGQLTIRSAPGEGTEVTVRVPYSAQG
jgi:signal transduction histidine kinase